MSRRLVRMQSILCVSQRSWVCPACSRTKKAAIEARLNIPDPNHASPNRDNNRHGTANTVCVSIDQWRAPCSLVLAPDPPRRPSPHGWLLVCLSVPIARVCTCFVSRSSSILLVSALSLCGETALLQLLSVCLVRQIERRKATHGSRASRMETLSPLWMSLWRNGVKLDNLANQDQVLGPSVFVLNLVLFFADCLFQPLVLRSACPPGRG